MTTTGNDLSGGGKSGVNHTYTTVPTISTDICLASQTSAATYVANKRVIIHTTIPSNRFDYVEYRYELNSIFKKK